jgi:hypothetical protein
MEEKIKHNLGTELFALAKLALQIMAHNLEDYRMTRCDFEIYLEVCKQFFI